MYVTAIILKMPYTYFTLRLSTSSMQRWRGDRFDRYSKTVYCACVLYVTLSCQQASATVPKAAILNKSSTLIFSAITKSILEIFLEESPKLIRIQTLKNEQNWSSGF